MLESLPTRKTSIALYTSSLTQKGKLQSWLEVIYWECIKTKYDTERIWRIDDEEQLLPKNKWAETRRSNIKNLVDDYMLTENISFGK
jgi:hypothetical protein